MAYPIEGVREMMKRTMANLRFIESRSGLHGPFEVTQLINSFLGAVAHPWEDLDPDQLSMSLEEAVAGGWPSIDPESASDRTPETVRDLVRNLRNAIAHGNISYWEKGGDIFALHLTSYYEDKDTGQRRRAWGALVRVEHLRELLDCFVALAEELYEIRHVGRPPIRA